MFDIYSHKIEYKSSPLGMDENAPRFSYKLRGTSKRQTARRLVVRQGIGDILWDSGWVQDNRTCQIVYAGRSFAPFTRYEWTVAVRDENGNVFTSEQTGNTLPFFETGFLGEPWKGCWIEGAYAPDAARTIRLFKDLNVRTGLVRARLCATALGLYECYLDGQVITDTCFNPGWTDYFTRVQYQVYDVTTQLTTGEHRLAVYLASGWFCGRIARNWNGDVPMLGNHPMFRCDLRLDYEDGSSDIIASDKSFKTLMTDCGVQVELSDIYMGEIAKFAHENWMLPLREVPAIDSAEKQLAVDIVWHAGPVVRRQEKMIPKKIVHRDNGTWIVDFGQNFTGREHLVLNNTQRGAAIVIRHGEMLNADGSLYTDNLRTALATTMYFCGTNEREEYEPHFTYYGFRFLEISGWPGNMTEDNLYARAVYSDLEQTGSFSCSETLLNQLYSNVVWGQKSNFLDVPTDCPQRDERFGWTADTQVFMNIATYITDAAAFYSKWIVDLNLCQYPNGAYPNICPDPFRKQPSSLIGAVPATGWGDAGIIGPEVMYRKYGDRRLLECYYGNMRRYLDMQIQCAGGQLLVDNATFGDWLNLDAATPSTFISTCYLAGMSRVLSKMATILGWSEEAERMKGQYEAAKEIIGHVFFEKDGKLTVETQTAALMILNWDLAPSAESTAEVAEFLIHDIKISRKLHLSTGFLGTPLLLKTLVKMGEADLAYDLLLQTTYPSWLYPVTNGATTMWERWNSWNEEQGFGDVGMNSFNHYAYGVVGEWFFEGICGIQPLDDTPQDVAFHHFRLAPQFGHRLLEAAAEYESPSGLIRSSWKRLNESCLTWTFTVPPNTLAEIRLPGIIAEGQYAGRQSFTANPGQYTLKIKA